jgi:hypothetical protein
MRVKPSKIRTEPLAWCKSRRVPWEKKGEKIPKKEVKKKMEIRVNAIEVSSFDSADELRYTNNKLGGENTKK